MYKKILLLATLLTLTACNIKEDSNIAQLFKKDDIYHISLLNTQKAQLIASLETKALLTATYLNPVYAHANCKNCRISIKNGEYFFIGIYINNSKTHHFNNKGYALTLDGVAPIEIKKLDKDDPLKYEMPMVDNWSTYYMVKFPRSNMSKFNLIFESDRFGKDTLEFEQAKKKDCRSNTTSIY
jgi:uncharacterized membrane protein YobD (UPF0266 family)